MTQIKQQLDYEYWLTVCEKYISTNNWAKLHPELKTKATFFRDYLNCLHAILEDLENGVLDKRIEEVLFKRNREQKIAIMKLDVLSLSLMHFKFDNSYATRETKLKDIKAILNAYNEQSEIFKYASKYEEIIHRLFNTDKMKPNNVFEGGNDLRLVKEFFDRVDWDVQRVVSEMVKDLTDNLGNPAYTIDKMLQINTSSGKQPLCPYSMPPWVLKIVREIIEDDITFTESARQTPCDVGLSRMEEMFKFYKWYALNHYLYERVIEKRNELSDSEIKVVLREGKTENSVYWGIQLPKKLESAWITDEGALMTKVNNHFLGLTPLTFSAVATAEVYKPDGTIE